MEARVAVLEEIAANIKESLARIERRMDEGFVCLDGRIDRLDDRIDRLDGKLNTQFLWLITFFISGFTGLFALVAHGLRWF